MMLPDKTLLRKLSREQKDQLVRETLRWLLSRPYLYRDGVDEILRWHYDRKQRRLRGVFVEHRGGGDRIFQFEFDIPNKRVRFWPLQGVR